MLRIIKGCLACLLFLLLMLLACDGKFPGGPLWIHNNSDSSISLWFYSWNQDSFPRYHYPDTILPPDIAPGLMSMGPSSESLISELDPDWDHIFDIAPKNKLSFYIFTMRVHSEEEWDSLRTQNLFVRKDVTRSDLVISDYVLEFP